MATAPKVLKRNNPYLWEDHDPVLDTMRTIKQQEGLTDAQISELSGLAKGTVDKWFNRSTKNGRKPTMSPKFTSVMRFARALGKDLRFVDPERKVGPSRGVIFQRNVRAKADVHQPAAMQ